MTDELMNHLTLARQTICSSSSMKDPRWCCIRPQDIDSAVDELARLRRDLAAANRARVNHAETLRGIADMAPASEGERMVQWARDGLSGYVESSGATINALVDQLAAANGMLDEVVEWSNAFQNENDPGSELNRLDAILSRRKGGA